MKDVRYLLAAIFCLSLSIAAAAQTYTYNQAQFGVGKAPAGEITADFNHDGFPDLATANETDNSVSILLGTSRGTFRPHVDYPVAAAYCLTAGDFNGDGKLDLAVVGFGGASVSILLGNGDGTFQAFQAFPAPNSRNVMTADFNGDGKLDLVTSNTVKAISILLGNGDGTFQSPVNYSTDVGPIGLTLGDFNNDGKMDVAVSEAEGSDQMFVTSGLFLGKGDGTFQPEKTFASLDGIPSSVTSGDFNHDGNLDLAFAYNYDPFTELGMMFVALGDGTGNFSEGPSMPTVSGSVFQITAADLNGDGNLDLVLTGVGVSVSEISVFLGKSNGTFQSASTFGAGADAAVVAADFNHDGKLDLAASANNSVDVLLGNGHGSFAPKQTVATGTITSSVIATDLNGDGKPDLALGTAGTSNVVAVLLNAGGHFSAATEYPVGMGPTALTSADFNHDGYADLAVANVCGSNPNCQQGSVSILLNKGDGTFSPQVQYATGVSPESMASGDFNGDGIPDLAVTNVINGVKGKTSVLLNNGDGTFAAPVSYAVGINPYGVTVGDFNGDGKLDLAVVNNGTSQSGTFSILLGNGDGTFQAAQNYLTGNVSAASIAAADLNADGLLDLVIANTSAVSILLGKGDGTFQAAQSFASINGDDLSVVVADINHDGKLDVAVSGQSISGDASFAVLLGNGKGAFQAPLQYVAPGGRQIAGADFNGDGKIDIVATDSLATDNSVTLYLNNNK